MFYACNTCLYTWNFHVHIPLSTLSPFHNLRNFSSECAVSSLSTPGNGAFIFILNKLVIQWTPLLLYFQPVYKKTE